MQWLTDACSQVHVLIENKLYSSFSFVDLAIAQPVIILAAGTHAEDEQREREPDDNVFPLSRSM